MRLIDADKVDFNEVIVGASDFARDTRAAAQSLIDGQPEISRWIPVEERLPEIGEPVLITVRDKGATIGTWYGNRWGTALRYNEDVLAWMPRPEPYRPRN